MKECKKKKKMTLTAYSKDLLGIQFHFPLVSDDQKV